MSGKLNSFFILLIVVSASGDVVDYEELDKIVKDCAEITHTKEAEYNSKTVILNEPSENLKCMGKCIMERLEIVNIEGKIQKSVLKEYLEDFPVELRSRILKCADDIQTVTVCEDIEDYRKCVLPTIHKMMG